MRSGMESIANCEHSRNAPSPIERRLCGGVIWRRDEHPRNAYSPMEDSVAPFLKMTRRRALWSAKAKGGMLRMPGGIVATESPGEYRIEE